MGGGQIDPLSKFMALSFCCLPKTKRFGTTVLCFLSNILTLLRCRHNRLRYHKRARNLCVDCEISSKLSKY